MRSPCSSQLSRWSIALAVSWLLCGITPVFAQQPAKHRFTIPAGMAQATLAQFARQAGGEFVFSAEKVRNVPTKAINGDFTAEEALGAMLEGTKLRPVRHATSGALTVEILARTEPIPGEELAGAKSGPVRKPSLAAQQEEGAPSLPPFYVVANPFEVVDQRDDSFSTNSVGTGGRLVLDLKDLPAMYAVINGQFIKAVGITDLNEAASWVPGQSFDTGSVLTLGNTDGQQGRFLQRGLTQVTTPNAGNSFGGANGVMVNFYQNPSVGYQDAYAVESYDFAQGPNGILFGGSNSPGGSGNAGANAAGLAGVSSIQTKRPRFDRAITSFSAEFGSWDYERFTIDHNLPLNERLGVRLNLLGLDSGGYIDQASTTKRGLSLATTLRLTRGTELTLEMSYNKTTQHNPLFPNENVSGWDGTTVGRGLIDSTMMPNTLNRTLSSLSKPYGQILGTAEPVSFRGEPNGVTRFRGTVDSYYWEMGSDQIVNRRGLLTTRRADATGRTPLWSATAPNGAFYVRGTRPGTTTNGVPNQQDVPFGVSAQSWLNLAGLPLDMYQRAAANSRFKPWGLRENFSYAGAGQTNTARDLQFSFFQSLGENLALGLGGDWNTNVHAGGEMDRDLNSVRLDINQLRPDGTPNPHFLEMFADSRGIDALNLFDGISNETQRTVDMALRANLAYNFDGRRWGQYSVNINGNINTRSFDFSLSQMAITRAPDDPVLSGVLVDPRQWALAGAVNMILYQSSNRGYREVRKPASFSLINSKWTGVGAETDSNAFVPSVTTSKVMTQWVKNVAGPAPATFQYFRSKNLALQSTAKWFDEKVILIGGVRRDGNSTLTKQSLDPQYYPSVDELRRPEGTVVPSGRWDAQTTYFKPMWRGTAQQYYALTYQVRDGQGNPVGSPRPASIRPTTTLPGGKDGGNLNGLFVVMDPKYASDRFQDDYSPPEITDYGYTKTYGVVWNPLPWFSPYINKSDQFIPSTVPATGGTVNLDMFGNIQEPILAKGTDFGAKFSFLGGKVAGRYNYYRTTRSNNPAGNNVVNSINALIGANRWDDQDPAQGAGGAINQLGVPLLSSSPDYATLSNFGYSLELAAQPLNGLRLIVNAGAGSSSSSGASLYPLTRRYLQDPARVALLQELLEDAGASLDRGQKPVNNGRAVAAAPGLAVLRPLAGRSLGLDATNAVNAYNNIWIGYDQLPATPLRTRNVPSINFFSDYTFQSGTLRGLRIGAGVQWQGPRNLGDKGAWTVLATDPTLGLVAVDDPTKSASDHVWADGNIKTQANLSYGFNFGGNRLLTLALRVNNIGTRQILYGSVMRQPNGDLTKPNRVSLLAGNAAVLNEPINFRLSATYNFGGTGR